MKRVITATLICILLSFAVSAQDMKVNGDRLNSTLQELAKIGKNDNGGSDRIGFSDYDLEGREYVMGLMKNAGLEVSIDASGNIIGSRVGSEPNLMKISFGSHIDEVPNGGDYDGPVGALSALEVMAVLEDAKYETRHPLEMIIFANEEGGVIGSRGKVGALSKEALEVVSSSGLTMAEGIRKIGGNPDKIEEEVSIAGEYAAYLELHIEQGANLDQEKLEIGVVEGIVAIEWWDITFKGMANHAGTTPMNMRKDPMLPAAQLVLDINRIINSYEGAQVGTVGKIVASPGAGNVIPGEVTVTLEIRDLSAEKIWMLYGEIEKQAMKLAEESETEVSIEHIAVASESAMSDPLIQESIENSAKSLGLSYRYLPSGAGHDAQEMAKITPIGMIFIPSRGGISHSPDEYSSPQQVENGANVLLRSILELDEKLDN